MFALAVPSKEAEPSASPLIIISRAVAKAVAVPALPVTEPLIGLLNVLVPVELQ